MLGRDHHRRDAIKAKAASKSRRLNADCFQLILVQQNALGLL